MIATITNNTDTSFALPLFQEWMTPYEVYRVRRSFAHFNDVMTGPRGTMFLYLAELGIITVQFQLEPTDAYVPFFGDDSRGRMIREVSAPVPIEPGLMVTLRGGVAALADPAQDSLMPAAGISLAMSEVIPQVSVQTTGTTPPLPYTFEPGLPVFVGANGTLTQNADEIPRPGWLQMVGLAADIDAVTLSISGQMTYLA